MKRRRMLFLLIAMLLVIFFSILLFFGLQPSVLPLGSALPSLACFACTGVDTLQTDGKPFTLVMLFSMHCPHCIYQLDLLNKNTSVLQDFRIYLITTDTQFRPCEDTARWLNLSAWEQVTWARMVKSDFTAHFGPGVSPSLFIFDEKGVLKTKIRGEVKIEKIIAG